MSSNLVGTTLLGQFQVESFVESGGMSVVYRVKDLRRNIPLAMKVLKMDLVDENPSVIRRFRREARALQKLVHPDIVPFYGLYETLDFLFLLEHFIEGPTLKEILKNRKNWPLSIQEIMFYLKFLCDALGYAHAHRVVHCDVKPSNVMVDSDGRIYLTDFGVARHADSTTTTLGYAGTPAYSAPEQIRGEAVTPATDVYSLGVMFFEMLTGQRPFKISESSTETASEWLRYAHQKLPPPDPHTLNPNIPEALAKVILRALEKDPKQRYQSAWDLYQAACNAIGDQLIAPQLPPPTKPQTRARTPAWVWVLTGAVAVVILIIGAGIGRSGNSYRGMDSTPIAFKAGNPNKAAENAENASLTENTLETATWTTQLEETPVAARVEATAQANATAQIQASATARANTTATAAALLAAIPHPEIGEHDQINKAIDQKLSLLNMVTLLAQSEPLLWSNGWCTTTKEILENNIEKMSWRFILDGMEIPLDRFIQNINKRYDGAWCMDYTTLLDRWPVGKHHLQVERITLDPITDGWSDFPAGTEVDDNFVYIIGQEDANEDPLDWPKIFEYTFSDDAYGNWRNKEDNEWWLANSDLANGKFILNVEKTRKGMLNRYSYALIDSDNFYLSVDARRLSGPQNQACYGIWFNGDEASYYTIKVCEDQTFSVYMLYNGTWHTIKDRFASKVIHNNQMNQVAILAKGDHFTLYINDEIVGEFTEQQLLKGNAGFFVELDQGINASYEFDNLILRAPYYP